MADASFNTTVSGVKDGLVAKFDKNGMFKWAGRIVGNLLNVVDLVADETSNIYVGAYTFNNNSTATAYDGSNNATLINAVATNSYVVKYLSSGTIESFANIGNLSSPTLSCVAVDAVFDAVYCGGVLSSSTFMVRDFNSNTVTLPAPSNGAYLCKLNAYGNATGSQWVAKFVYGIGERVVSAATNSLGYVYALVGHIGGSTKIYPANSTNSTTPSKTFSDLPSTNSLVIIKLNTNGGYIWAASITGANVSNSSSLTVYNDELYVQVETTAAVTVNDANGVGTSVAAASIRQVVCKYTSEGNLAWCTWITSSSLSNVVFEKNYLFASSVCLKMIYSNVTIYGTNSPIALPTSGSVLINYNSAGEASVVSRISN